MDRNTRILIAEDDEVQRELLKSLLELEAFEVLEAHNGTEALAMVESHCPHLLITDLFMPEMDGYTLIRSLRSSGKKGCDLPVVLLSAADRDRRLTEGRLGRVHYIQKPIDMDDFLTSIRQIVSGEETHPSVA